MQSKTGLKLKEELDRELVHQSMAAAPGFILTAIFVTYVKMGTQQYKNLVLFIGWSLIIVPFIRFIISYLHSINKIELKLASTLIKINVVINAVFWAAIVLISLVEYELSNAAVNIYTIVAIMSLPIASLITLVYNIRIAFAFQWIMILPNLIYLGFLYFEKNNTYAFQLMLIHVIQIIYLTRQSKFLYRQNVQRIQYQISLEKTNSELKENQKLLVNEKIQSQATTRLATAYEISGELTHEINNPLTIITGNIELLFKAIKANKLEPATLEKKLNNMLISAGRISKILHALRYFSQQSESSNTLAVHNISDIINDTLIHYKEKLNVSGINLETNSTKDTALVECKSFEITQVLLNILSNAVKALHDSPPDNRKIIISTYNNGKKIIISIANTGEKIKEEFKNNLFKPIINNKVTHNKQSLFGLISNIGLGVSKNIIDEYKGSIYYDESQPLTTFVIELPIYIQT